MNTIKERLIFFCDRCNLKIASFEKSCGFCNGYVQGIRKSISDPKLAAILKNYPDLNRDWLMYGEGLMLKTDTPEKFAAEMANNLKKRLLIFIATYAQMDVVSFAESLGLQRNYFIDNDVVGDEALELIYKVWPTLNAQWLVYGLGEMVSDENVTIYDRIKSEFKKYDIELAAWEVEKCGFAQGTLSRCKGNITQTRLNIIKDALPKKVNAKWILEGKNGIVKSAAEPSVPYLVRMYDDSKNTNGSNQATTTTIEVHEKHLISEGTKGLVIPINLSRNPKCKLSDISSQEIELGKIMPSFKFMYQVQTHQLEPMVSQGDWLMLDTIQLYEVVNNEIYLINTKRFGVMVRCFQWVNEDKINLINIDNSADVLETEPSDIYDICAITSILKNCTSFLPFAQTALGQTMMHREKLMQQQMDFSKDMFEELKKNNVRTDTLIDLLTKKI